jgi:hypothetical protein
VRAVVIEGVRLLGPLVEELGQRAGLSRLGVQPRPLLGVVGRGGLGGAQDGEVTVMGGGLVGAGEFVVDIAGRPCGLAVVGADPRSRRTACASPASATTGPRANDHNAP